MRVRLHPEAIAEARAARRWYAERDELVGAAFMAELDRAVELVARLPGVWPLFEGGTRRFLFKRFPYYLIYRERDGAVEVVAVMHARRHPGYWRHR
ncbi:MAG: type II toxin-antitoxin system RelE/ParE family toxin [Myxococcales bacterium]|nr:type II toxin-antitoxin system RelE/ParE family toxin [Myxococcales bacterium]